LTGGRDEDLTPRKRGPKWKLRRTPAAVEEAVIAQRKLGLNLIYAVLRETSLQPLSHSTLYRLFRRHGLNRLQPPMIEAKRRILKQKLGELGHVDLHQLPADMFLKPPPRDCYVVSLIDACSRLAWPRSGYWVCPFWS
jgi:hypothetical protein